MPGTAFDIDVERYEALVRRTALMIVEDPSGVEMEYDDICQRLRIKCWYALGKFEGKRDVNEIGVDRFVFSAVTNEKKDILKKVRRNEAFIEDIAPSGDEGYGNGSVTRQEFEGHYLQVSPDEAFHDVEEQLPFLPSTLSAQERQLVHWLYLDYDYGEISRLLGIPRKEVAPLVRGIREKAKAAGFKPVSALTDSNAPEALLPANES
jgi:RNA polymerase sigma factor (sigma-70 family)